MTRNYMRYVLRYIKNLLPLINSPAAAPGQPYAAQYANLAATVRQCVIPPSQFEGILDATEQALGEVYQGIQPQQRQEIEMQLLVVGQIPPVLYSAVNKILVGRVAQARVFADTSEAELAFRDWGAVSLGYDAKTMKWKRETLYDSVRKVELKKSKIKLRTCLRCCGHMEDIVLSRSHKSWLQNMMRTCYCGGHWVVEKPLEM
jgi:hypothetical protein